jgi:PKD repeat protein
MDRLTILLRCWHYRLTCFFGFVLISATAFGQLQNEVVVLRDPPSYTVTANPKQGRAPLIVQYLGKVFPADPTTTWLWQFPGGKPATSTVQNPVVRYNRIGTYSATMSASNSYGSTNVILPNYIEVTGGNTIPVEVTAAEIEINPFTGGAPDIMARSSDNVIRQFQVDPNPARDEIRVRNKGDQEVREIAIYSAAGQNLQIIPWPGQRKECILHLSDHVKPDGIYWLQVRTATGGEWIKIAVIGR